jgi:hypothetical protein
LVHLPASLAVSLQILEEIHLARLVEESLVHLEPLLLSPFDQRQMLVRVENRDLFLKIRCEAGAARQRLRSVLFNVRREPPFAQRKLDLDVGDGVFDRVQHVVAPFTDEPQVVHPLADDLRAKGLLLVVHLVEVGDIPVPYCRKVVKYIYRRPKPNGRQHDEAQ